MKCKLTSHTPLIMTPRFFGIKWTAASDVLICAADRPMSKTFKSAQEIEDFIAKYAPRGEEDTPEMIIARVEQWMIAGATALPREKTLQQRERYFGKVKFSALHELLLRAKDNDGVL